MTTKGLGKGGLGGSWFTFGMAEEMFREVFKEDLMLPSSSGVAGGQVVGAQKYLFARGGLAPDYK
jgi:hypothetical protein